jgi:hypothetical protein
MMGMGVQIEGTAKAKGVCNLDHKEQAIDLDLLLFDAIGLREGRDNSESEFAQYQGRFEQ